jgi:hypothetical protein
MVHGAQPRATVRSSQQYLANFVRGVVLEHIDADTEVDRLVEDLTIPVHGQKHDREIQPPISRARAISSPPTPGRLISSTSRAGLSRFEPAQSLECLGSIPSLEP